MDNPPPDTTSDKFADKMAEGIPYNKWNMQNDWKWPLIGNQTKQQPAT